MTGGSDFELLSKEVYLAEQEFEREANQLYRGKVLINRMRTRDLLLNRSRGNNMVRSSVGYRRRDIK